MVQHEPSVWYLGIGSMMSLNALSVRGVHPIQSRWCEILGFRRVHYPSHGMATLFPEKGASAQAVAHEITPAELEILEGREPPSLKVRARLRDTTDDVMIDAVSSVARFVEVRGIHWQSPITFDPIVGLVQESSGAKGYIAATTPHGVVVIVHAAEEFDCKGVVTHDELSLGIPTAVLPGAPLFSVTSARYRDLMVEGARAVGMDEAVIAEFSSMPVVPRKTSAEFRCLPLDPSVASRSFSEEELRAQQEKFAVFRGRVLQCPEVGTTIFPRPLVAADEPLDSSLRTATFFYDPLHGRPPKDPHQAWSGWDAIEDWAVGTLQNWKHVGWLAESCVETVKPSSRL